jgi:hypothetical protein
MTIGELKELLNEIPDDMTELEFNELEFMFSVDGSVYFSPCECETGVMVLEEEDGNEVVIFAVAPHGEEFEMGFDEMFDINPN